MCIHEDCIKYFPSDTNELILLPKANTDWGDWKSPQFCDPGAIGTQFAFQWERPQGHGGGGNDDSGGVGFFIGCEVIEYNQDGDANARQLEWIGARGEKFNDKKHIAACETGSYLYAIQINSEHPGGDDMALCNVRLWCKNPITGTEKRHEPQAPTIANGWTDRKKCPMFHGIAGVQLKIEEYQGRGDDTMLNKIKLFCKPIYFANVFIDNST